VSKQLRNWLWALSALIWIFSAGFDGRFLRGLMYEGWGGAVMGYGLNFVVDVCSEMFAYLFALLQRERKGSRVQRWSWLLLLGEAAAIYFAVVFSWQVIRTVAPDLPPVLQWSAAAFAPCTLLWLGIGQALLDVRIERDERGKAERPAPEPPQPKPNTCKVCGQSFAKQQGLNAHMRKHKEAQC